MNICVPQHSKETRLQVLNRRMVTNNSKDSQILLQIGVSASFRQISRSPNNIQITTEQAPGRAILGFHSHPFFLGPWRSRTFRCLAHWRCRKSPNTSLITSALFVVVMDLMELKDFSWSSSYGRCIKVVSLSSSSIFVSSVDLHSSVFRISLRPVT